MVTSMSVPDHSP